MEDSTTPALHGDAIRSVAFNVDGSLFATVGDDKRVKLWDAKTWTCIKTMYVGSIYSQPIFLFKNEIQPLASLKSRASEMSRCPGHFLSVAFFS